MKNTRLKQSLLFGLFILSGFINAQTNFKPGYVIKSNGDTLIGNIDYRGDMTMGKKCRFIPKDADNELIFTPEDIDAYRFYDSKYYVSRVVNKKKFFLEYLIKGEMNIYYLKDAEGGHYYLEKDTSGIIEIPYEEGFKYRNNSQYVYKSTQHIGMFNYYMQDAPSLQSKIAKFGKPVHKNLISLAKDYNDIVCKDNSCIIYEKKLPPLKLDLEIIGGYTSLQKVYFSYERKGFQGGILAHLWMPRSNENMFLKTGLLYLDVKFNGHESTFYKIPIQFEYKYPKGIIRPVMALGINLYDVMYSSLALSGGLNIKLYKSVYLDINYDIDFVPDDMYKALPNNILTQSIMSGILFKF